MVEGVFKTIPTKDVKLHDKFYAHKSWSDTYVLSTSSLNTNWNTDDGIVNNNLSAGANNVTYETLSSGSYENISCRKYAMLNAMFFEYSPDCYASLEYIQNSANNIQVNTQVQFGNKNIISTVSNSTNPNWNAVNENFNAYDNSYTNGNSTTSTINTNNTYKIQKYQPISKRYLQSTVTFKNQLPNDIICISIPQSKIGMHIHYGSVSVVIQFKGNSITLMDNGHGELIYNNNVYGRIMYSCGIIIIYNTDVTIDNETDTFTLTSGSTKVSWKSTVMLYQNHVLVRTKKDEFNVSQNPSLIEDDENGLLKQNIVKFDAFTPYVTTIGLYNDTGDLLVVARLSKPIPKRHDIDINFLIKWDY